MTRRDLLSFERFIADTYRREARARAKRYPAIAEQLNRWAEQADQRIEAVRCGPLFDQDARA